MKYRLLFLVAAVCVPFALPLRGYSADIPVPATITVTLPVDAVLTIDKVPTAERGPRRVFQTPTVESGTNYSYTLRAEIVRDGQLVRVSKTIFFRAGAAIHVDFGPLLDGTASLKQEVPIGPSGPPLPGKPEKEAKARTDSFAKQTQEVVELTNQERKKAGLPPLQLNAKLARAAQEHSANMARLDRLDHVLEGKGPGERLADVGYTSIGWGENCAAGQRTPEEALASWMQSPGHRGNILNSTFTEIGVGIAANDRDELYYTQVFGRSGGKDASGAELQPGQGGQNP